MANDPLMSQEEIERLLSQAKDLGGAASAAAPGQAAPSSAPPQADDAKRLRQNDMEKLLHEATAPPPAPAPSARQPPEGADIASHDIDYLLTQAERALESVRADHAGDLPASVSSYRLEEFTGSPAGGETATLDLVRDVELDVKIELGRTQMYLEDVLKLRKGSVVPLDKLAGDPVDVYVNGRLVARGEVLVLNDNFCVRVAELIVGANVLT
jgi:flagellar motor switch protein FliN/FliY